MSSLRGRLTIAVVSIVALSLGAMAAALFVGARRAAWKQHDAGQLARAQTFAALAEHDDDGYELELPEAALLHGAPAYLEVWLPDGGVLVRSHTLGQRDLERAPLPDGACRDTVLPDGRRGRVVELRFVPRDEATGERARALTLVLAEGTEDVDAAIASARTWFAAVLACGLVIAALVTAWLVARGMRPLARLATQIARIDNRRLETRFALDGHPAELAAPINKLNELLARLDASFARERAFTADVGHELRTPLAGLRTMLEVTALMDRSAAEYRAAIARALAIVVQLGALVENLLGLARLDGGELEIVQHEVSLRPLVDDCWRLHAELADSRSLVFENRIPVGFTITTDREKLKLVVGNLLANAAQYTSPGGWIAVTAGDGAVLDVIDSGPPIPADQLAKVFERLWRGDAGRSSTGVHCGIGLSLARGLCDRLSLSLGATSQPDGSVRFRIEHRRGSEP